MLNYRCFSFDSSSQKLHSIPLTRSDQQLDQFLAFSFDYTSAQDKKLDDLNQIDFEIQFCRIYSFKQLQQMNPQNLCRIPSFEELSKKSFYQKQINQVDKYLAVHDESTGQMKTQFDSILSSHFNASVQVKETEGTTKKKRKPRSEFHNFQKHLITTVRRLVSLNFESIADPAVAQALREIWERFMTLKVYTKELLLIVTCESTGEKVLRKYGFDLIRDKCSEGTFRSCQSIIREKILSTFQDLDEDDLLEGRKLKKKDEFLKYLMDSIEELKGAFAVKRHNKQNPK